MGQGLSSRTEGQQPELESVQSARITDPDNVGPLFEAFNDPDARRIMEAADDRQLSAKEFAAECDLPLSTTYRKLNRLSDLGLLEETIDVNPGKKHTRRYGCCFEEVQFSLTESGFEIHLTCSE